MDQPSIEIAREERPEFRSVMIEFRGAGIRLSAQDFGPSTRMMGSDGGELEFWVDIPPQALQRLCAIMIRDRYNGEIEAVSEFRAYCEENEIKHEFMIWS
jgi:hypothetical protein